ncbi:MAG: ABC transporter permease [Candidatus Brockarchaeota archaeon]|nr:ABC transporter permease [Candidatus Brockarchaeota archaeon]
MKMITLLYLTRYALRDIASKKLRAGLTVLGISIGIASLVSLFIVSLGMRARVESEINTLLGSSIIVRTRNSEPMSIYVVHLISNITGVERAVPVIIGSGLVESSNAFILAVPVEEIKAFQTIVSGSGVSSPKARECLMPEESAKKLGVSVNSTVRIVTSYVQEGVSFKVTGLSEIGGLFQAALAGPASVVVMSLEQGERILNKRGLADMILVRVYNSSVMSSVVNAIRSTYPSLSVSTEEDVLKQSQAILDTIDAVIFTISAISIIVAGVGTMNTITMSIREKIREIGVLKSIGASPLQVLYIFLVEGILLGISGGLFGSALGMGLGYVIVTYLLPRVFRFQISLPFIISYEPVLNGLVIAVAASFLSSLLPSWNASRIRPVEALRYE